MKYIIRMSMNWRDRLKDRENIIFFNENSTDNTIDIEIEDIDIFTSKNNFNIEYELLTPGLIKLGLNTVGIIISPNFRNKEAEDLMRKMLIRQRKYGIRMVTDIQNYDNIAEKYLTNNKLIKLVERALDKSVKSLSKEQLESLMKIINGDLDNSRKMFLIGEVFEGKILNFMVPEGEEYKNISSSMKGTTLNIEKGVNQGISEIIDRSKG
ncbi:hypothetical protein OD350_28575 (plasmid) [Clostridium beijerinckii]|uniref:hypothetical protein n=1 Tax=Clostridium beijerinckii TaxID=1520 RepID=UPI002226958E|nr:hypothetical protein [Clostridium beijerinckii]UYZ39029.1 hypothetical protein OD350_28575 [Clostridium beijerinckii]